MKNATRPAALIVQSLEVSIDVDTLRFEDPEETSADLIAARTRVEVATDLLALLEKHGVAAILEAVQCAAEMAADATEGHGEDRAVRSLHAIAAGIDAAGKAVAQ